MSDRNAELQSLYSTIVELNWTDREYTRLARYARGYELNMFRRATGERDFIRVWECNISLSDETLWNGMAVGIEHYLNLEDDAL